MESANNVIVGIEDEQLRSRTLLRVTVSGMVMVAMRVAIQPRYSPAPAVPAHRVADAAHDDGGAGLVGRRDSVSRQAQGGRDPESRLKGAKDQIAPSRPRPELGVAEWQSDQS
jgi:hypothetical protein